MNDQAVAATLYDGTTAVRRVVRVRRFDTALAIDGEVSDEIPLVLLRHVGRRGDVDIYARQDRPGWRLALPPAPWLADVLPASPALDRRLDAVGLKAAVAGGLAALAIVAVVAVKFVDWVTPLVPDRLADRIGAEAVQVLGQRGGCTGAAGQAALERLVERLQSDPAGGPIQVHVIDTPTVNAFAVPGRHIGVLRGLIEEVKTPDELAGVLAHEVAHVEGKHPLRGLLRASALGFALQNLGGDVASLAQTALLLTYTRGAESDADIAAIAKLRRIDVSPKSLADFLAYVSDYDGEDIDEGSWRVVLRYASTHPLTGERTRRLRAAAEPGRAYKPAFSPAEWQAVQTMCEASR